MIFRDQLILSFIISFILISCSSENESDSMITPPSSETFGSWSPNFSNQTNNFTQTRKGSNGSTDTRTINISSSTNSSSSFEKNINIDVNNDGDMLDEINIITITYTANNNLGSHQQTENEILDDKNNYFKIGQNTFSILRVAAVNYLNELTCNGIPSMFNQDLTFYSETENEEIYFELYNNDSEQLKLENSTSFFSYLNPFFENQFNNWEQMGEYFDNDFSNQDWYDLYNSFLCNDSEYNLITSFEVEFQGNYYDVDLEENFNLDIDLYNETYTVSMTGYIRQDSDNLASEKVELFYEGSLDFEVYDNDHQPDEINDFLSSNDQNENSYELNILYDSNFNLNGTFKTEESTISSNSELYLIDDNLIYFLRSVNSTYVAKLFTSNNNYLDFGDDPYSYPDRLGGKIIQNDEGYFDILLMNSDNPPIYKFRKRRLNFDRLDSSSEITIDLTNFGPDEYFSKSFNFGKISSDNLNNLYLKVEMKVQDVYTGETQNSIHLIKYNPLTKKTIWSIEFPSSYLDIRSGNTSYGFFNNKENIMFYGFNTSNSSTWFKIYNSNTGELIYEDILNEFTSGGIVVNGFYEDSNHLFLYGEYGLPYVINKSSFTHDILYTYTYGNSDFCDDYPIITGVNKFNENYVIMSNVYKNDDNEGIFSIDIRDDQGNLLNNFSINNTGSPQHLFKLSDDSFLIVGSKEMCINETLGARSRIIKFELTNINSNRVNKISDKLFKIIKRK